MDKTSAVPNTPPTMARVLGVSGKGDRAACGVSWILPNDILFTPVCWGRMTICPYGPIRIPGSSLIVVYVKEPCIIGFKIYYYITYVTNINETTMI